MNASPWEFKPKAVLAPHFWFWRTDRPAVMAERNGTASVFMSVAEAFAAGFPSESVVRLGPGGDTGFLRYVNPLTAAIVRAATRSPGVCHQ